MHWPKVGKISRMLDKSASSSSFMRAEIWRVDIDHTALVLPSGCICGTKTGVPGVAILYSSALRHTVHASQLKIGLRPEGPWSANVSLKKVGSISTQGQPGCPPLFQVTTTSSGSSGGSADSWQAWSNELTIAAILCWSVLNSAGGKWS